MAEDTKESDIITHKDLFLEGETQCCLCGHDLHFKHEINFAENTIAEFAKCAECHVELRTRESILH